MSQNERLVVNVVVAVVVANFVSDIVDSVIVIESVIIVVVIVVVRIRSNTYQTLLCRFEGLGREAVQAEQPGFVIGGTGTETTYQQTKWRTWLFSIWLSFDIVRFA